jgi:tetratricopeptide (TPR) repeat protein
MRLSNSTETLPSISAQRHTEPAKLTKLVRGELDWIVMKALEKDRSRRYETANGFAADVQRYLADEPVQACPPSAGYRLRKFVRRNRVTVTAALVVLLVLIVGIAATTWALIEARWQRDEAQQQRLMAETNRRAAHQAVHDYFTIVSESTLLDEPALEPLRKQLLQAALSYYQKFAQAHQDDPKLQAELVATHLRIGTLIYHMGPDEDWLPPIQNAVAVLENLLRRGVDASDLECLKSGIDYGNAMRAFYVRDQAEALRTFVKARSLWEELVRLDPKAPGFRNTLAHTHLLVGVLQEYSAVPAAERVRSVAAAVDIWRELVREEPGNPRHGAILVTSLRVLGMYTAIAGANSRSAEAMQEARAVAELLAADFPGVPGPLELLHCIVPEGIGAVQEHTGKLKEAEGSYREMLANQEALQREYPSVTRYQDGVIRAWRWLGWVLWGLGRREDAADAFRQMKLAIERRTAKDPDTQDTLAWLLATCPDARLRDAPRALQLARQAVERVPRHGVYWSTLGAAHYAAGEYAAAIRALEKGAQLPNYAPCYPRFLLAMAHFQLGSQEEARQWYEKGVASLEQELNAVESVQLRDETRKLLGIKSK